MVNAAIFVPQPQPRDGQHARIGLTHIGQQGWHFTGLVLQDWPSVAQCLREHLIDVVVDGQDEHRPPGWHARAVDDLAPVVSLDRQRAETTTRRLWKAQHSRRHYAGAARVTNDPGMTTGQMRRILTGVEPAPEAIDPETVAAIRSIASRLGFE